LKNLCLLYWIAKLLVCQTQIFIIPWLDLSETRAIINMMSTSIEKVSLQGPEDWETWNNQFKSKAISTDLWKFISSNGEEETEPFTEKPIPPNISNYDKKLS
jgi:hypothetical protein